MVAKGGIEYRPGRLSFPSSTMAALLVLPP
jgi:hypothetical protein